MKLIYILFIFVSCEPLTCNKLVFLAHLNKDSILPVYKFTEIVAIPLIGKVSSQGSTHTSGGTADKAVDGNTDGDFGNGPCTHTGK